MSTIRTIKHTLISPSSRLHRLVPVRDQCRSDTRMTRALRDISGSNERRRRVDSTTVFKRTNRRRLSSSVDSWPIFPLPASFNRPRDSTRAGKRTIESPCDFGVDSLGNLSRFVGFGTVCFIFVACSHSRTPVRAQQHLPASVVHPPAPATTREHTHTEPVSPTACIPDLLPCHPLRRSGRRPPTHPLRLRPLPSPEWAHRSRESSPLRPRPKSLRSFDASLRTAHSCIASRRARKISRRMSRTLTCCRSCAARGTSATLGDTRGRSSAPCGQG